MISVLVILMCLYLVLKNSTGIRLLGNVSRRQFCTALFLLILVNSGALSQLGFMIGRFGEFKREYSDPGLFQVPGQLMLTANILRVMVVSSIVGITVTSADGNMVSIAWLRRLIPAAAVLEAFAASGYEFARIQESTTQGESFGSWIAYCTVVFMLALVYGYAMLVLRRIKT